MKLYTYLIRNSSEYYAQRSEQDLWDYLQKWHLYSDELSILFETGIYNHDNLGIIEYNILEMD